MSAISIAVDPLSEKYVREAQPAQRAMCWHTNVHQQDLKKKRQQKGKKYITELTQQAVH